MGAQTQRVRRRRSPAEESGDLVQLNSLVRNQQKRWIKRQAYERDVKQAVIVRECIDLGMAADNAL
jgi:hypothetical protein